MKFMIGFICGGLFAYGVAFACDLMLDDVGYQELNPYSEQLQ